MEGEGEGEGGKSGKVIGGGEEDRISPLPDSILHRILSSNSIGIRGAVQTCVLSKRWRYVWTSLPNLLFDSRQLQFPKSLGNENRTCPFTHFVNQVLSLRDHSSNVCNFYFSSPCLVDKTLIKKCICYAVCHNVQQLHVVVNCSLGPFEFPRCFINSESLKVLTLVNQWNAMPLDTSLRLPALETMHLSYFGVESANFITETVGNCPNLESLSLVNIKLKCCKITAPKLRKLKLCYKPTVLLLLYESKIVVSAPRLTSFELGGNVSPVFSTTTSLLCLDNVYVDLSILCMGLKDINENVKQKMPLNVIKMLGQLGEAKCVTLSMKTLTNTCVGKTLRRHICSVPQLLKILAEDPNSLKIHASPFHKLKHLNLIIAPTAGRYSTLTLPLNVITYLTKGSSCGDTLVVKYP